MGNAISTGTAVCAAPAVGSAAEKISSSEALADRVSKNTEKALASVTAELRSLKATLQEAKQSSATRNPTATEKNIDAAALAALLAPPFKDLGKVAELAGEDGEDVPQEVVFGWLHWSPMPGSACWRGLHENFPGSLPAQAILARTVETLTPFGLNPENTLYGQSLCPDEINHVKGGLSSLMAEYWGGCFPLGGIGGPPFVGRTGFGAFSHHVPDEGHVLVMFGPHVAVSESGEVGKVLRPGQSCESTACGAVIAGYNQCLACSSPDDEEIDENDMQQCYLRSKLRPHVKRIRGERNPMAALALQAYEIVKEKMLGIVNTSFGMGNLVLIGGIQINMPRGYSDHFMPLHFEVRNQGEEGPPIDLLAAFNCQQTMRRQVSMNRKSSKESISLVKSLQSHYSASELRRPPTPQRAGGPSTSMRKSSKTSSGAGSDECSTATPSEEGNPTPDGFPEAPVYVQPVA